MISNKERSRQPKTAATRKKTTKKGKIGVATGPPSGQTTPEERHRQIAEAAYFKAERRGFSGTDPEKDWYEAEAEIDATLGRG